ncbi:hypothetical protein SUGI_0255490 [Cryptomeria japonica]|nr:hypothetical protein SUGI_0255490 [Cryptomeria japonica]
MQPELTAHAIHSINAGDEFSSLVFQLLSFIKLHVDQDEDECYRVVLSDGTHMQLGIIPPKYRELFNSNTLKVGLIVSLTSFVCRSVCALR